MKIEGPEPDGYYASSPSARAGLGDSSTLAGVGLRKRWLGCSALILPSGGGRFYLSDQGGCRGCGADPSHSAVSPDRPLTPNLRRMALT